MPDAGKLGAVEALAELDALTRGWRGSPVRAAVVPLVPLA
jgi:hypothetical protein